MTGSGSTTTPGPALVLSPPPRVLEHSMKLLVGETLTHYPGPIYNSGCRLSHPSRTMLNDGSPDPEMLPDSKRARQLRVRVCEKKWIYGSSGDSGGLVWFEILLDLSKFSLGGTGHVGILVRVQQHTRIWSLETRMKHTRIFKTPSCRITREFTVTNNQPLVRVKQHTRIWRLETRMGNTRIFITRATTYTRIWRLETRMGHTRIFKLTITVSQFPC